MTFHGRVPWALSRREVADGKPVLHRADGDAIYSLLDYLKISGELKANYTLSVSVNGQKLAERNITEKDLANPLPMQLTVAAPSVVRSVSYS